MDHIETANISYKHYSKLDQEGRFQILKMAFGVMRNHKISERNY